jgi:hypothetical protein
MHRFWNHSPCTLIELLYDISLPRGLTDSIEQPWQSSAAPDGTRIIYNLPPRVSVTFIYKTAMIQLVECESYIFKCLSLVDGPCRRRAPTNGCQFTIVLAPFQKGTREPSPSYTGTILLQPSPKPPHKRWKLSGSHPNPNAVSVAQFLLPATKARSKPSMMKPSTANRTLRGRPIPRK